MTLDEAILKIIEEKELTDQTELQRLLGKTGHLVSQSTLSRHLRKLGVQKAAGRYRRVEVVPTEFPGYELVEVEPNLLVLTTRPGHAQVLAVLLDENRFEHIVGTLAGDDTILVVVTPPSGLSRTAQDIRRLISSHFSIQEP